MGHRGIELYLHGSGKHAIFRRFIQGLGDTVVVKSADLFRIVFGDIELIVQLIETDGYFEDNDGDHKRQECEDPGQAGPVTSEVTDAENESGDGQGIKPGDDPGREGKTPLDGLDTS